MSALQMTKKKKSDAQTTFMIDVCVQKDRQKRGG